MIGRRFLRALGPTLAVGAISLSSAATASAQVVVVTVKSAGELLDDLRGLVKAVAPPDQAPAILKGLDVIRSPDSTKGLDRSRPLGAYATLLGAQGEPPSLVVFVPVTDSDDFLATLRGLNFVVDDKPGVPGFSHKLVAPGAGAPPLYAVVESGYALFSSVPTGADALKRLKPASLRPDRPGTGDISVSVRFDAIPAEMKAMALQQVDRMLAPQRVKKPGEDEVEFQGGQAGLALVEGAFKGIVNDGKELALDLDLDPKRSEVGVELVVSARAGSPTAAALRGFSARQTVFRGIGRGSLMSGWLTLPIPPSIRGPIAKAFEKGRDDAVKKAANPAERAQARQVLDAIRPTIAGDEVDLGAAFYGPFPKPGGEPTIGALFGLKLKEGRKIEQSFRSASRLENVGTDIRLDFAKSKDGTAIHRATSDAKGDDLKMFGKPYVFLAFRDDLALVSLGEDGLDLIQKALDLTKVPPEAAAPQVDLSFSAARLVEINPDDAERKKARPLAASIFRGPDADKDRMRLNLRGDGDSLKLRLSLDLPVLKFFAAMGSKMTAKPLPNP